jgi:hypothetical protein
MPYRQVFEMPALFAEIEGHRVFHTYKNDNLDEPVNGHRFTLDPYTDEFDRLDIDIRTLPGVPDNWYPRNTPACDAFVVEVLKDAFKNNLIEIPCLDQNSPGSEVAVTNAHPPETSDTPPSEHTCQMVEPSNNITNAT